MAQHHRSRLELSVYRYLGESASHGGAMQASHIMDNGADTEEAQKQKVARKRIAIAAEALSSASDVKIPNIPKTEAVLRVLGIVLMWSHCLAVQRLHNRVYWRAVALLCPSG